LLFDASGRNVAVTATDAGGRFAFGGLAAGAYRIDLSSSSVSALRSAWTPTTTGSWEFRRTVNVDGTADGSLGLRRIVRSSDPARPISEYVGPSGVRVRSYNDVVDAQTVHRTLLGGSLVGPEAAHTVVRLDLGTATVCYYGASQSSSGTYEGYSATVDVAWLSWLAEGEQPLFHEYGHAWAMYHAYITQQDPSLGGYLRARGLENDSRVGTSVRWDPKEMIAEDYRQLFGSAAASAVAQANNEIPRASEVPGLRDYLAVTFTTGTSTPPPPPAEEPAPAPAPEQLAITGLGVNPSPVTKSGKIGFSISMAGTVTVQILDSSGTVVRTLLADAQRPAGTVSTTWDRKDSRGRRVAAGTYRAAVRAVATGGPDAVASQSFSVV
jgi:hypothetical protein